MKNIKKIMAMAMASMMIMGALTGCGSSDTSESGDTGSGTEENVEKTIKVGVCLYKFDDTYISTVRQALETIAGDSGNNVEFEFFNGNGDQATQNDTIDMLLQQDWDLLMVNLVDIGAGQTVVDKIKAEGMPVVFFNREPSQEVITSYDKAVFVGTNALEAGVMQGEILGDLWASDQASIDKNGDNVLQYVMLQGEPDNPEAVARTEYSVSTLEDKGIEVEQLEIQPCNWDQAAAQTTMEAWFANHGENIEVVIANNDGMALGAIAALQAQGYNNGGDKYIQVVGVDAVEAAKDYIEQGFMTGSVLQDAEGMADALYEIGMNLAQDKGAIDGTSYNFDDSGVSVRIPYQPYTK